MFICNFNPNAIKYSNKVREEITRLINAKVVKFVLDLKCLPLPNNYINVRSIIAKLDVIECDSYMNTVDIMCFCETTAVTITAITSY